jgi:hypothetical protein
MTKRKTKKMITKSRSITNEIDQFHACIQSDQNKLTKVYEKVTANSKKSILRLDTQLGKLKQKVAKMKKGKGKKVNDTDQKNILSLQKELDLLKADNAALSAGHTKFLAQQKALQIFENEWRKKLAVRKPKAKHKKTSVKVGKKGEMAAPQFVENKIMKDIVA